MRYIFTLSLYLSLFLPPSLPPSLPLSLSLSITISEDLKDLLMRLLNKEPSGRITIPEIRKHSWFLNTTRYIPSPNENCAGSDLDPTEEDIADAVQEFQTPIHILVSG